MKRKRRKVVEEEKIVQRNRREPRGVRARVRDADVEGEDKDHRATIDGRLTPIQNTRRERGGLWGAGNGRWWGVYQLYGPRCRACLWCSVLDLRTKDEE